MVVILHDINRMTSNTSLSPIIPIFNKLNNNGVTAWRLFDGNVTSGTTDLVYPTVDDGYIGIDLGQVRPLSYARIHFTVSGTNISKRLRVQTSLDNISWTEGEILTVTNDGSIENIGSAYAHEFNFNYVEARYIRFIEIVSINAAGTISRTTNSGMREIYLGYDQPTYGVKIELNDANTLNKITDTISLILLKNGVVNNTLNVVNGSIIILDLDETSTWSIKTTQNENYNALSEKTIIPTLSNPTYTYNLVPTIKKKFNFYDENNVSLAGENVSLIIKRNGNQLINVNITTGTYTTNALYDGYDYTFTATANGNSIVDKSFNYDNSEVNVVIKKPVNRIILKTNNKFYSLSDKTLIVLPNSSIENVIEYGISEDNDIELDVNFDKIITVNSDGTTNTETVNTYSVYDYISENPTLLVYSEINGDLTVTTDVNEFNLYEKFDDSFELLTYVEDESINDSNLILEANYSPLDELEGDFEVVTWTDDKSEIVSRNLELNAIPSAKFVKFAVPKNVGVISSINSIINENTDVSHVRVLLSANNNEWKKWDGVNFITVDASTTDSIYLNGNTIEEINNITPLNFSEKWKFDKLSIGVLLQDDIRDEYVSIINDIIISELLPVNTSKITNASLYILNTTATINLQFANNTLNGTVSDEDLTRVQYRVILNGKPYFPMNGQFTNLADPPVNIDLTLKSSDIKINDFNNLVVEFRDYFGTTDTWEVQFMGKYSGLIFRTVDGEYYSSDIGEVLKYLDFGIIVAGKSTIEHTVVLKNEFGYNVKDVLLAINNSVLPSGLKVEFKKENDVTWSSNLALADTLITDQEARFNIRMVSEITAEPRENGRFDIYVSALKE